MTGRLVLNDYGPPLQAVCYFLCIVQGEITPKITRQNKGRITPEAKGAIRNWMDGKWREYPPYIGQIVPFFIYEG